MKIITVIGVGLMMVGAANAQVKVLSTVAESDRVITQRKGANTISKITPKRSNALTLRSLSEKEHTLALSSKKNTTTGSKAATSVSAPVNQSQTLYSK